MKTIKTYLEWALAVVIIGGCIAAVVANFISELF
jgi:hypothetical protein